MGADFPAAEVTIDGFSSQARDRDDSTETASAELRGHAPVKALPERGKKVVPPRNPD